MDRFTITTNPDGYTGQVKDNRTGLLYSKCPIIHIKGEAIPIGTLEMVMAAETAINNLVDSAYNGGRCPKEGLCPYMKGELK